MIYVYSIQIPFKVFLYIKCVNERLKVLAIILFAVVWIDKA